MTKQVTAILVVHDEPVLAQRALDSISAQSVKPDRLVVIDSSKLPAVLSIPTQNIDSKSKLGQIIKTAIFDISTGPEHWLWLVHDDSEPKPDALSELLNAIESSDNIAQVGPMQLAASAPRRISQLGLTLSPFGEPISPISGQLDQSQHDSIFDTLAVSTSGMLIRSDVYLKVGGIDDRAPALAADIDLSMRIRRHGYRVVVAPRAKVVHAGLSMSGKRSSEWFSGGTKTAMRKAAINIHLVHDFLPVALLYWLALPLITLYRLFWRLAQKRPSLILSEVRAGVWGIITLPKRLASRALTGKMPTRSLKKLRASWATVGSHKRADSEAEESAQSLAAFERGDHETLDQDRPKNFAAALGWLFVLGLLAVSWQQFPLAVALEGGSALPLSQNWFELFARAGASWQPIGPGFFGPSDPFNWVLLTLGSTTFWATNQSLVFLLWLARALAFVTSWKALSLITGKTWTRNLGALTYSLLPAFTVSIGSGEFPAVIATIVAPWLVYAVARAAGLGRSGSARSDARTWSWVGLAGVLMAIVGACSPALAILSLLGLAFVAFTKIRRFGYLFWIPLPLAVIYFPLVGFAFGTIGNPLVILAEPTLGVLQENSATQSLLDLSQLGNWSLGLLVLLSLGSLLIKRWVVSLAIFGFGMIAFVALKLNQSLSFPADFLAAASGESRVASSGHSIAALIGLVLVVLAVHFLSIFSKKGFLGGFMIVMLAVTFPLGYQAVTAKPLVTGTDGNVVPLLLQKQSQVSGNLRLLIINQIDDTYQTNWVELSGNTLEDANLAYRFSAESTNASEKYQSVAQVVGDLVSGNGAADLQVLGDAQIGYVLVPSTASNANLISSLEGSTILEGAGLTPFGELWRVSNSENLATKPQEQNLWSITKSLQLMGLLGFTLLAIPSRPKRRREKDETIFIDQSESDLDV